MAQIRSGREPQDKGSAIALLFNAKSLEDGDQVNPTFQQQRLGAMQRAKELGFHSENYFLKAPGMNAQNIDRILKARGIRGLVLMAPGGGANTTGIDWNHYACSTIAYSWVEPETHRVTTDHRHHVDIAFQTLIEHGCKRIGFCLPPEAVKGVNGAWTDRFLLWTHRLEPNPTIPLFIGDTKNTSLSAFKRWFNQVKPDGLITLLGLEYEWLKECSSLTPQDGSLICLNRPSDSPCSGMQENHEVIGSTAVELVINQIIHNEYGLPADPKLIMIKGQWVDGTTNTLPISPQSATKHP